MKYMGSKRWQLENGLGSQLRRVARHNDRFVDLFAGTGAVSAFASGIMGLQVEAFDLQHYAVAVTGSLIERDRPTSCAPVVRSWIGPARAQLEADPESVGSDRILTRPSSPATVAAMRRLAAKSDGVFTRSYGGHYFSVRQTRAIDLLRESLPTRRPRRTDCLAALIMAASRCSASPGHTAQPFQPSSQALPHIDSIWRRDLLSEVELRLRLIAAQFGRVAGRASVGDANEAARQLKGGELVFLDPPYSAAQYSRFYHVLEAVAIGGYESVHGAGRTPDISLRARSSYSTRTGSRDSLTDLLRTLSERECRAIATFPQYQASNGLAGEEIGDIAREWFDVDIKVGTSKFSTLGGNGLKRASRLRSREFILTMYPR